MRCSKETCEFDGVRAIRAHALFSWTDAKWRAILQCGGFRTRVAYPAYWGTKPNKVHGNNSARPARRLRLGHILYVDTWILTWESCGAFGRIQPENQWRETGNILVSWRRNAFPYTVLLCCFIAPSSTIANKSWKRRSNESDVCRTTQVTDLRN